MRAKEFIDESYNIDPNELHRAAYLQRAVDKYNSRYQPKRPAMSNPISGTIDKPDDAEDDTTPPTGGIDPSKVNMVQPKAFSKGFSDTIKSDPNFSLFFGNNYGSDPILDRYDWIKKNLIDKATADQGKPTN